MGVGLPTPSRSPSCTFGPGDQHRHPSRKATKMVSEWELKSRLCSLHIVPLSPTNRGVFIRPDQNICHVGSGGFGSLKFHGSKIRAISLPDKGVCLPSNGKVYPLPRIYPTFKSRARKLGLILACRDIPTSLLWDIQESGSWDGKNTHLLTIVQHAR